MHPDYTRKSFLNRIWLLRCRRSNVLLFICSLTFLIPIKWCRTNSIHVQSQDAQHAADSTDDTNATKLHFNHSPAPRRTNFPEQAHESDKDVLDNTQVWEIAVATNTYPVLNRKAILPENQLCGAARLQASWKENIEMRDPVELEQNPSCTTILHANQRVSSNDKLTIFVIYYENVALLSAQISSWLEWPVELRKRFRFLVIDDGSQVGLRASDLLWKKREVLTGLLDIEVYEVEQDIAWNIGGARNLAAYVTTTEFMVLTDCDLLISAPTAEYFLILHQQARKSKNHVIFSQFRRLRQDNQTFKPHPAVMLLSTATYWRAGGCDEDFVGRYGHTDTHFFWRANRTPNITIVPQDNVMLRQGIPPIRELDDRSDVCPPWAKDVCDSVGRQFQKRQREKNAAKNNVKFRAKREGQIAWSNEYLRFDWHKAYVPITLD